MIQQIIYIRLLKNVLFSSDLSAEIIKMLVCVLCLKFRYERLEEQLSDLTELHQNEMTNLKQELASMEEKVAYQSYERARDIQVYKIS